MTKLFFSAIAALLVSQLAFSDTIAIIGTGDVGSALGPAFAKQGHAIIYGSREPSRDDVTALVERTGGDAFATTPASAAKQSDIVVLAIPGLLVEEVALGLGDLSGKILIDPTNPLERTSGRYKHGVETSNAEIIQNAASDAKVVKAFNTLSAATMANPASANGPVSIPLAGDSTEAKRKVAALVTGMGLEPIDVGPIDLARWVEGMLILWINNRIDSRRPSFEYHLRQ
jgi:NADPH-dependent F420 reductase